jgi:DNA-binding response OmpR family regulator
LVAEDDEGLGAVLMRGLRSKLIGARVRIETVRGIGYRIVAA